MNRWLRLKENMGDDPPFLPVGTEVSAKYRGAFCEAKISKVVRSVKYKVISKSGTGPSFFVPEDRIRGNIRLGGYVEVKNDKSQYVECSITKIKDLSQYTVVFNDGDIATLRRTALCLKSGRHFAESETLDQLPLTHPEHFSTPVISASSTSNTSNRRGRRNRLDDDSGDEELVCTKSKQYKSKTEKEADIGKVVCVELSDNRKKLSRDNWFPGLIVSPTAQNTAVKIQIKNEYLIRSFKDGRYYTVPKKETQEFTRDIASKVENTSLKTAVEKALLFLDKDELPPHWDRDILFGLGDSGSSDSDGGFDSDSSDDEPREEKDHFVAQLYKFMDDRGTPINKGPVINFKDVDLYKLFKVVHKLGGYNRVTRHNQWKLVSQKLGYSHTGFTPNLVKFAYKKYLHSFEDFYRKLGCTMISNPRGYRSRSRSGRSLIRDKDRSTPVQRDKSEDKSSKDDSSSERKDDDSDKDSDTRSIKDGHSSTPKASTKLKDEKPDIKSRDEKPKSETETKVIDEELKKDEKKIRSISTKNTVESSPKTNEKSDTDAKVSKKDSSKVNKDDKDSNEPKDGKSIPKTDRDNRMSKKLSALEDSKDKKPRSILSKVMMKRKNPKNAEKGAIKDNLSTLQNTRRKRSLKEKVKEIAKIFKLKKSGPQDIITKATEEESDDSLNVEHSQKTSDSEASSKQSTRSKFKDESVAGTKSRKQSLPPVASSTLSQSANAPSTSELNALEKKSSGSSNISSSNSESGSGSSANNSGPAKNKKLDDDFSNISISTSPPAAPTMSAAAAAESAKKKLGKKKKDEDSKPGASNLKDGKVPPSLKSISIGDKLKVYYGPSTQDSKKVTYEAKVLNIKDNRNSTGDEPSKLYLVHYTGWNTRYDEWIPLTRIADNLTGHHEGGDTSGTETGRMSADGKSSTGPPKSGNRSGPPSIPGRNKSPGNSTRPPSSRILAKKSRTRKISSQNTDGSESENDSAEMDDAFSRNGPDFDDSEEEHDFQSISESSVGNEITTRSRRDKQRKVPDNSKDSDNSSDSRKKDENISNQQLRGSKKMNVRKRKNSEVSIKTVKSVKDDDDENEDVSDNSQSEPRKKVKNKPEEEDSNGSASKKKGKPVKEPSKDSEEMDLPSDASSASKKKISTRSNKDSSMDETGFPETPTEKTLGSSGKKVTTRSSVIKRSPRCKTGLYLDEIDDDADVEDMDEDPDVESSIPLKKGDLSFSASEKKASVEKDKESSSKKFAKSKSPIVSSVSDVKEQDAVDKKLKSSKPDEEASKKDAQNSLSGTENIYQRRYSGRRSALLKSKLNKSDLEDKSDSKVSPKGRDYDLAAIRSELKGLSKTRALESDIDLPPTSTTDKAIIEDESLGVRSLLGSSFEDDNDQSMETATDSSVIDDTAVSSTAESIFGSSQKKSGVSSDSVSKKSASMIESTQKNIDVSSDTTSKKLVSASESAVKKSSALSVESRSKTPTLSESALKRSPGMSDFSQKKTVAAESVSKKISSPETVTKKNILLADSPLKKAVSAQETTPKKSAPETTKKKQGSSSDVGVKRPDPATPNRFSVFEQPSSDVDDIYEFKDSDDPFEFMECRSKTGSSDEKNPNKLTPRRPAVSGISSISSSPKLDNHDSRSVLSLSSMTPKKKAFTESLSSPPPLVSFSSEVPNVASVTASIKRKLDDGPSLSSTQDSLFKKKTPVVTSSTASDTATSVSEKQTPDAAKLSSFDSSLSQSSEKAKLLSSADSSKAEIDRIKIEPVDVKPTITTSTEVIMEVSSLSSLSDPLPKKEKLFTSSSLPVVSTVLKTEADKSDAVKPVPIEKPTLQVTESHSGLGTEKPTADEAKFSIEPTANRKNQKPSKQTIYSRDNKHPPPLVARKTPYASATTDDKISDVKPLITSLSDSKVSSFDSSRSRLSPSLFSNSAASKSADSPKVETSETKPIILSVPAEPVKPSPSDKLSKESINGVLSEVKPIEVVVSSADSRLPKEKSSVDKHKESTPAPRAFSETKLNENEAKSNKDVSHLRKDYPSLKQRKPILSKEFINEDSSSSDSSSNDFDSLLTTAKKSPAKAAPPSGGRNFQSIFDSSSSNEDDDRNDEDDDDEGNLQICLEVSSQEEITKAIIGEDNIDDDNDADDDDDGLDTDDDDLDDDDIIDEEDEDDDDSCGRYLGRKGKKHIASKKQGILSKDRVDSSNDLKDTKHVFSKEMDMVDERNKSIKEEKGIKKEEDAELKMNEASDENDLIDNELLCEEIIPKSPPPSGMLLDSGSTKQPSSKSNTKSKEMPFASALSSNCSYSGSDKVYSSNKNLNMFPPKTIKTLQPSSSKFRSSSSTNNDRKELSSASESNDSSKVLLMDITPPLTPEHCLSPVSNSPIDDQSNSSPAHMQDDGFKSTSVGLKAADFNDDSQSTLDTLKSASLKRQNLDSIVGSSRKRRRSETDGSSTSKGLFQSYDSSRKKSKSNQQSPRAAGSDSEDGSEHGNSTMGSSPSNSSVTKAAKNNFFVELDPELDGSQRIAILQQKLQDLRKTYMTLKQELACIDRRRKKICRREREGYAYGLRSMNSSLVRNQE